ncbi:hypothetical protein HOS61_gp03 [Klebsiella phage SH-Kp 152410]|uniref:Uncharacterized protein n=1 Tax=Klebsiella phage SH-Kp 152410 TaxID=2066504 RepID=A0A2K9VGX7_9CAUD|nr:hypothetical protein HOS61_gp03 [Klebsiella phage SH-Kp 152410]AUV61468.1 hypothetical protein 2410_orf00003 [Klebsiella phage SH-Kp 152410]
MIKYGITLEDLKYYRFALMHGKHHDYLMAALRQTKWGYSMSLRIDTRHIRAAQLAMAYGASDALTKRILTKHRKMTARQAACAVKWARLTLLSYQ